MSTSIVKEEFPVIDLVWDSESEEGIECNQIQASIPGVVVETITHRQIAGQRKEKRKKNVNQFST